MSIDSPTQSIHYNLSIDGIYIPNKDVVYNTPLSNVSMDSSKNSIVKCPEIKIVVHKRRYYYYYVSLIIGLIFAFDLLRFDIVLGENFFLSSDTKELKTLLDNYNILVGLFMGAIVQMVHYIITLVIPVFFFLFKIST